MSYENIEKIIFNATQGDERLFNIFFKETFKRLLPRLMSLTKSKEDSEEIFTISMQKFWERFVINQEALPHNSLGYINIMCKNTWLMYKRNLWNSFELSNDIQKYSINAPYNLNHEQENLKLGEHWLKHKALSIALEALSKKCKTLMEAELDTQIKLKDLQKKLGFSNYQALIQAKYNCKKRLVLKVHEALEKLKKHNK